MSEAGIIPTATGVAIKATRDNAFSALLFRVQGKPEPLTVALPDEGIRRLATLIISRASARNAAATLPKPLEQTNTPPIAASLIGIETDQDNTEACLAFRIGNMDLTLAVSLHEFFEQCSGLLSNMGYLEQETSQ